MVYCGPLSKDLGKVAEKYMYFEERNKRLKKAGIHLSAIKIVDFMDYVKRCGCSLESSDEELLEIYEIWSMGL